MKTGTRSPTSTRTARPYSSIVLLLVLLSAGLASSVVAQAPLTLDDVLHEARAHNVQLPVAALDTVLTRAGLSAARGRLWPDIGLGGHLHGGTPSKYASGDGRLQLMAEMPIYSGGRLRAEVGRARADYDLSVSRYQVAERDLDLEVRLWFSAAVEIEEEIALRQKGVERLGRYIDLITARREAGEPVTGDLLKARVRRGEQAAEIEDARRQHAQALLMLKELMGRQPEDDIVLAPLPPPAPPESPGGEPWTKVPDVQAAEAAKQSASAAVDAVRSGRRPQLDLAANVGTEPVLGSSFEAPLNTGQGSGAEVTLTMTWPLWDRGVYRGELSQAKAASEQASREAQVARREAKLQWYQTRADLTHLDEVVQLRRKIVPTAEDAYLQSESLYRGGDATALEVLDAFDDWMQASLDVSRATLDYRNAQARALRWGSP